MNTSKYILSFFAAVFFAGTVLADSKAPIIKHRPVSGAAMNQSLNFRAQVTSPDAPLESVTLHFTTSTDSTPVKIPMKPVDATLWSGTIPAGFLAGYRSINYYIEAINADGLLTETAWYRVDLLSVDAAASAPADPVGTGRSEPAQEETTWVKPALIAGGAVAVAGGAVLLLAGGGGGGGGSDNPSTNSAGTYVGTATTCYETSTNTSCTTDLIAITVSEDGYASSDTLCPNVYMNAPVDGDVFTMMGEVPNGQITYSGTILSDRIVGSISGSGTAAAGSGTYSGTFSAERR